jgi:threonyl-tRNA synthetase
MNDMRVHIKDLAWGHVRAGATVGEALEQLGRDVAGHALAARVDGREVDLGCRLGPPDQAGDPVVEIEPILPGTLEGLGVLRHSTAHLLAAAVLDLFPGTKLGIGPALLDDPRFGFFYDVIAPARSRTAILPDRFGLEYVGADGKPHRPIMIHRALFGSLERFLGVLIEHYAGAFPVWLAPVQVAALTVADRIAPYAGEVVRALRQASLRVELNARGDTIGAKIREAQLQKIPFMLVLGDREAAAGTVSVRERSRGHVGVMSVEAFAVMALGLVRSRAASAGAPAAA